MSESKRSPSSIMKSDDDKNDASPTAKKRARHDDKPDEEPKEIFDLATKFGLQDGDRIEVAFQVGDEEEIYWWGASLLPWNKEVVDECVALRELKYDAYPAQNFFEESIEQVVFLGENLLAYPESGEELNYRREGEEFIEEGPSVHVSPAELVEQTLKNAMNKHKKFFSQLPASQQALIAEKLAQKREQLVQQLEANPGVVNKSRMNEILASIGAQGK